MRDLKSHISSEPDSVTTKLELTRRHRAQPVLIESLIMALEIQSDCLECPETITMKFILNLCQFSQRMKWLCPWGPKFVDEISRPPTCSVPLELRRELHDIMDDGLREKEILDDEQLGKLVDDESQQWDRIYIGMVDNMYFLYDIPKHPCEELHFWWNPPEFDWDTEMSLALCENLRALSMDCSTVSSKFLPCFSRLGKLEMLCPFSQQWQNTFCFSAEAQINLQRAFPNLTSLYIDNSLSFDEDKLLDYIQERKMSLQHVMFSFNVTVAVAEALSTCEGLVTVQIHLRGTFSEDFPNLDPLLWSPHLHKTVQCIDLSGMEQMTDFRFLRKYTALRWVWLNRTKIGNDDVSAMLLQNAQHIAKVSLRQCPHITSEILTALEKCTCVRWIDLDWSGVEYPDALNYQIKKRRNFEAIEIFPKDDESEPSESSSDSNSDE